MTKAGGETSKPIFEFPGGRRSHFRDPNGMNMQYGQCSSSRSSIVVRRCEWVGDNSNPLDIKYPDEEWGVPVHDDRTLFEFLIL